MQRIFRTVVRVFFENRDQFRSPAAQDGEPTGREMTRAMHATGAARRYEAHDDDGPEGYSVARMPEDASRPSARALVAQHYERYSEGLLTFFRTSLPISKPDATDLLQQTFEELLKWLRQDPERTIEHPQAFLYKIAHRRLSAYRDKQRRIPDEPQGSEPALDSRAHRDDGEFLAAQHETQRLAMRAMRRLERPDATVMLYLRYWSGLTEREIGEVMGRSRSTVTGQLRRAKQALLAKVTELAKPDPNRVRTSTTLLLRWWRRIEEQARKSNGADDDDQGVEGDR